MTDKLIAVAHCSCGSSHYIPLGCLYSCPKCGLITSTKITEERPCAVCDQPDKHPRGRAFIDGEWRECPACRGSGFMSPEVTATTAHLEYKLKEVAKTLTLYADETNWWTIHNGQRCTLTPRDDFDYGLFADGGQPDRHKPAAVALALIRSKP